MPCRKKVQSHLPHIGRLEGCSVGLSRPFSDSLWLLVSNPLEQRFLARKKRPFVGPYSSPMPREL